MYFNVESMLPYSLGENKKKPPQQRPQTQRAFPPSSACQSFRRSSPRKPFSQKTTCETTFQKKTQEEHKTNKRKTRTSEDNEAKAIACTSSATAKKETKKCHEHRSETITYARAENPLYTLLLILCSA
jgi:hypothetical protein